MSKETDNSEASAGMPEDGVEHECLRFMVGGQSFAFHANIVRQVVAPPAVTPLPFSPAHLEGLISINEGVLPLIDLAAVIFPQRVASGDQATSEILVLDVAPAPCAVRVDLVQGRCLVAESALRRVDDDGERAADSAVIAEFSDDEDSVLLLDPAAVTGLAVDDAAPVGEGGMLGRPDMQEQDDYDDSTQQCLLVVASGERYGIPLGDVLEVIDDVRCSAVPGAPAEVEGLALIREEPLLVLRLAGLLGLEGQGGDRVVVVARGTQRYGLRVDDVSDIASFDEQAFREMDEQDSALSGVLVQHGRLCGVLDLDGMLPASRLQRYRHLVPREQRREQRVVSDTVMMLHVKVSADDYAIPLHQVQRVVEYCAPECLDDASGEVKAGIVSIAGEVLPTLDLDKRTARSAETHYDAWVVLQGAAGDVAVPVSRAHDIISIETDRVDHVSRSSVELVTGIVHVDGRMISVVDASRAAVGGQQ